MSFDAVNKPFFQPPSWVFGPVWAILYTTLAISFFSAWNSKETIPKEAYVLFIFQLAFNLTWANFFNDSDYSTSFLIIVGMIAFTVGYCVIIYPYNPLASLILIPYLLWITFAGIINAWYYFYG